MSAEQLVWETGPDGKQRQVWRPAVETEPQNRVIDDVPHEFIARTRIPWRQDQPELPAPGGLEMYAEGIAGDDVMDFGGIGLEITGVWRKVTP